MASLPMETRSGLQVGVKSSDPQPQPQDWVKDIWAKHNADNLVSQLFKNQADLKSFERMNQEIVRQNVEKGFTETSTKETGTVNAQHYQNYLRFAAQAIQQIKGNHPDPQQTSNAALLEYRKIKDDLSAQNIHKGLPGYWTLDENVLAQWITDDAALLQVIPPNPPFPVQNIHSPGVPPQATAAGGAASMQQQATSSSTPAPQQPIPNPGVAQQATASGGAAAMEQQAALNPPLAPQQSFPNSGDPQQATSVGQQSTTGRYGNTDGKAFTSKSAQPPPGPGVAGFGSGGSASQPPPGPGFTGFGSGGSASQSQGYSLEEAEQAAEKSTGIRFGGQVVAWRQHSKWGTHAFVRHGEDGSAVYRLDPGHWHDFNYEETPCIDANQSGIIKGSFKRDNVERVLGVAWRVNEEYEDDPPEAIRPAPYRYPMTFVYVKWKTLAEPTWETRTAFRRLYPGKTKQADLVIFEIAQKNERNYNTRYGITATQMLTKTKDQAKEFRKQAAEHKREQAELKKIQSMIAKNPKLAEQLGVQPANTSVLPSTEQPQFRFTSAPPGTSTTIPQGTTRFGIQQPTPASSGLSPGSVNPGDVRYPTVIKEEDEGEEL